MKEIIVYAVNKLGYTKLHKVEVGVMKRDWDGDGAKPNTGYGNAVLSDVTRV